MITDIERRLQEQFSVQVLATIQKLCGLTVPPTFRASFDDRHTIIMCELRYGNANIPLANFFMEEFPGNGDVLVSHAVSINQYQRGKGLGTLLNAIRSEAAREAGASAIICTVREDNAAERLVLFKNGWKLMTGFKSKFQQEHPVEFWIKEL